MGHMRRVWHTSSESLPLKTPGSVPRVVACLIMLQLLRLVFPNLPFL